MSKGRLEAFSDGVIAILITIMVLEMKVPRGTDIAALRDMTPVFLSYALSFVIIGIYWVNHHHLLHATERITGGVLWANLHLLFWLSLIPFLTGWLGENHEAPIPTACYGLDLLFCAIAYTILQRMLLANPANRKLAHAVGGDTKGKISLACYIAAIPLAFVRSSISDLLYVTVALIWLIPDSRIERRLEHESGKET